MQPEPNLHWNKPVFIWHLFWLITDLTRHKMLTSSVQNMVHGKVSMIQAKNGKEPDPLVPMTHIPLLAHLLQNLKCSSGVVIHEHAECPLTPPLQLSIYCKVHFRMKRLLFHSKKDSNTMFIFMSVCMCLLKQTS